MGLRRAYVPALVIWSVAFGAAAQEPQPAPGYFLETIVATTTAQNLALACPYLSFDIFRASTVSDDVLARLADDGFDAKNLEATMADPADEIRRMQQAFLVKHGLPRDGADFEAVCAAGLAEIAEGTAIGGFLTEITGEDAVDPTEKASE
ncbi:DUF5333 family protein [Tropicimonas marinistellae]|uniref:DUF5333 family protein n=1 Tax=Tropicimonas marinistellae TaxID=1739787 RepID=UPI000834B8CF|nr:DUF5333 family protein [Tropicimonas marinistellae]